jgi:dihydroflavonol-4-reductase
MLTAITGASGHVGACLCRRLLEQGRRLRLLVHRDTQALEGLAAERVQVSLDDPDSLARACDGVEVVYHLAVTISLDRRQQDAMTRTNVEGTRNLLAACSAASVRRLVHFSSIEALSDQGGQAPTTEDNPLAGPEDTTAYGWSKARAEALVREAAAAGLDAVIVNPTAIIGPWDYKPSPMGRALISLARGGLPVLVQGGFTWIDVRDVVDAAIEAERRAAPGERYLLGGTWLSLPDIARLVNAATGRRLRRTAAPFWAASLGAALIDRLGSMNGRQPVFTGDTLKAISKHRRVSTHKAERELGFRPRSLEETVPDTLSWFREQGYLAGG